MLKKYTTENTPKFSLAGEYLAKVINVVDGDTVDVAIKLSKFGVNKHRVRLVGIDAPETRTKNLEEKKAGKRSKKELTSMVGGKLVKLVAGDFDNFGRILGHIIVDGDDVGDKLVSGGFAKDSPDGHRVKWTKEDETPKMKTRRASTPFRAE